jgi:FAD synthase
MTETMVLAADAGPRSGSTEDSPRVEGLVEHGDARGRTIGFPTANISVPKVDVQDGVWAGTVQVRTDWGVRTYAAAISIGRRPTYYNKGLRLLEAHLLDYAGDLYGRRVLVTLQVRIRPQRRFRSTDELVSQIEKDVDFVRRWSLADSTRVFLEQEAERANRN